MCVESFANCSCSPSCVTSSSMDIPEPLDVPELEGTPSHSVPTYRTCSRLWWTEVLVTEMGVAPGIPKSKSFLPPSCQ